MRDDLYGFTQIISPSFFVDYILVNPSGSNIIGLLSRTTGKSFVMSEIEVCFCSVVRHITFAMLVWI